MANITYIRIGDKVYGLHDGNALTSDSNLNASKVVGTLPANTYIDTTYENKAAVEGGTDVSLVTTGDKYRWNNASEDDKFIVTLNETPYQLIKNAIDANKLIVITTSRGGYFAIPDVIVDNSAHTIDFVIADMDYNRWSVDSTNTWENIMSYPYQQQLTSGENIKTINNQSVLGSGNLTISGGLQNLVDGSATGSVRGINTAAEDSSYTMGTNAFAEGERTKASGKRSHAEGFNTTASGNLSHAEGGGTTASGDWAHAEGSLTTASGDYSHAQNNYTIAAKSYQTAIGKFNIEDTETVEANQKAFIIGNGSANNNRSNALTVDWQGNVDIASGAKYKINGIALSASDVGAQPTLVSGTNIKTINNESLLGSGNIDISSLGLVQKHESTYTTTSSSESTIPIGISGFRSTDVLFVDINGLDLVQGTDYTISGSNIILTTPITTIGTVVHFVAMRMAEVTTEDYAQLKGDPGTVQIVRW